MNKSFIIALLLLIPIYVVGQTEFDKSLNTISIDLAEKLNKINRKRLVVLYVSDINKVQTAAGKYMANAVSVNIVNQPGEFQVFDRDNIDAIAGAKRLRDEGYIDADRAKQIGQLLSVDVIVIGSYTALSNTIRLTLKALDARSGFVVAAAAKDLPLDADARILFNSGSKEENNGTVKKEEVIIKATTGKIEINNKVNVSLLFLLGTETVEPANYSKQYFQLNVAARSADTFDALSPGTYYVCGMFGRPDISGCIYNKRVVVEAGKTTIINVTSLNVH